MKYVWSEILWVWPKIWYFKDIKWRYNFSPTKFTNIKEKSSVGGIVIGYFIHYYSEFKLVISEKQFRSMYVYVLPKRAHRNMYERALQTSYFLT